MAFADHFSERAAGYAAARPTYPPALFGFIASAAPGRDRAWDCATGNGQAALGLARHFVHVDATDASAEQVSNAMPHDRVHYRVESAEAPSFADACFDAVCVAQALHWFEAGRFHAQVHRVLKRGGLFAAWGYSWHTVDSGFDAAFEREVLGPLQGHWPAQNRKLWNGYRDEPFPYERIPAPELALELDWSLDQMLDYVGTWSATRARLREDPRFLERAREALEPAWETSSRKVTLPIVMLAGRHAG